MVYPAFWMMCFKWEEFDKLLRVECSSWYFDIPYLYLYVTAYAVPLFGRASAQLVSCGGILVLVLF